MHIVAIESTLHPDLLKDSLYTALFTGEHSWDVIPNQQAEVVAASDACDLDDDIQRAMTAASVLRAQRNKIVDLGLTTSIPGVLVDGYIDTAWVHVGDIQSTRFQRYFADAVEESVPLLTVLILCSGEPMACDSWRQKMRLLTGRATLDLSHYLVVNLDNEPDLMREAMDPAQGLTHWAALLVRIKAVAAQRAAVLTLP